MSMPSHEALGGLSTARKTEVNHEPRWPEVIGSLVRHLLCSGVAICRGRRWHGTDEEPLRPRELG
jgi:hypothetical protein